MEFLDSAVYWWTASLMDLWIMYFVADWYRDPISFFSSFFLSPFFSEFKSKSLRGESNYRDNTRVIWRFSKLTKYTRDTHKYRSGVSISKLVFVAGPGSRFDYQYLGRCISPEAHNRSFMRQCWARISSQRLWNAFSRLRYCLSITSRSLRPILFDERD